MTETVSVVRLCGIGLPVDVLRLERMERPEPRTGEVGISVKAFALNRADWLYARGWHYTKPVVGSRIGSECAGVVESIGPGVTRFRPGDRVASVPFDTSAYGVHGEYAIVPERYTAPWPLDLSAIEATSIWMQYLTAYFAFVEVGALRVGDHVLITAASSSAGLGAAQIAKLCGAHVTATTRSHSKVQPILEAGADVVLVVEEQMDLSAAILQATNGAGVRLVYDPVAGPFMRRYLPAMSMHARIFIYGLLSGAPTELDIVALVRRAAIVHPYSMFNHVCDPEQLERGIAFVLDAITRRGLRPRVGQIFPFHRTIDAYRELDADSHFGKLVVDVAA
jgi:NADPH:quinone reductase-like Zn-dependent oxidoreductase